VAGGGADGAPTGGADGEGEYDGGLSVVGAYCGAGGGCGEVTGGVYGVGGVDSF